MKRQLVKKGMLALVVSVAVVLCFVPQPSDSVYADSPTPTPGRALLQLEADVPEGHPSSMGQDTPFLGGEAIQALSTVTLDAIADTMVAQGQPNTNFGVEAGNSAIKVGYEDRVSEGQGIVRGLVRFDLSSIPAGSTINGATLKLYYTYWRDYSGYYRRVTAYRVTDPWMEDTVTWNNRPGYGEAYGFVDLVAGSQGDFHYYDWDVTSLVQTWVNCTYNNYGIMLRGDETLGLRAFGSRETGDAYTPQLIIDYTPPPPPTLGASPALLRFRAYGTGPNPEPKAVTISNITAGSLDWSAAKVGGASWLGLDKTSGTVTPSSPDTMNVSVSTSGLAYGTYTERIAIETTALTCSDRTVDVVFDYYEAQAPEQWIFLPIVTKDWDGTSPIRGAVALVVGVAEYPYFVQSAGVRAGGDPSQLQFTDDDARAIRDVAIYKGNFRVEDVMTLLNTDGTRAAIENGFDWLDDREDENTLVLVSFSGHGGQAPDAPPYDEADGKDEFIAPSDTTLAGDNIILDDELDAWLSRLESKHIVVIIDSCNSGGMIDLAGVAAGRGIGFVLGTQGVIAQVAEADGLAADINREGRVVLVASRTDQESWEFGALQNGVFSYYFVEGLSSPIADGDGNGWISAEEAFSYLECRVDNYVYENTRDVQNGPFNQNPQLYDGTIGEEWITQP